MRRRLFNLAAAVSLVLFVVTAALWFASWLGTVGIRREAVRVEEHRSRTDWFVINHGKLVWSSDFWDVLIRYPSGTVYYWHTESLRGPSTRPTFAGFEFEPDRGTSLIHRSRYIAIPCWFVMLVLGILPAVRARSLYIARRRGATGRCPVCGYDLRATPDRCPECGLRRAQSSRAEAKPHAVESVEQ